MRDFIWIVRQFAPIAFVSGSTYNDGEKHAQWNRISLWFTLIYWCVGGDLSFWCFVVNSNVLYINKCESTCQDLRLRLFSMTQILRHVMFVFVTVIFVWNTKQIALHTAHSLLDLTSHLGRTFVYPDIKIYRFLIMCIFVLLFMSYCVFVFVCLLTVKLW